VRKKPIHPRLYTNISGDGKNIKLSFKGNVFDQEGSRLVNHEFIESVEEIFSNKFYLYAKNKLEYEKLIKYIKIQKKVLENHQKYGNYDSSRIVKSSIVVMEDFKDSFENWFKNKSEH
jgi:hydroxymethylpyrimidine/phosphomethylpyrimidine kinase